MSLLSGNFKAVTLLFGDRIVDFMGYSYANSTPLKQAMHFLSIMQVWTFVFVSCYCMCCIQTRALYLSRTADTEFSTCVCAQNHYPERLGVAIAYGAPGIFSFMWKGVRPAIDTLNV